MAGWQLPVALLPQAEVPKLEVRVSWPGGAPAAIEQQVLQPLREAYQTLTGLQEIESRAWQEGGQLELSFAAGTVMGRAYVDASERTDRTLPQLPRELPRPIVVRKGLADVPLAYLHIVPPTPEALPTVSRLAEQVLKRRLEALPGVAIADLNGHARPGLLLAPYEHRMAALGIDRAFLGRWLTEHNQGPLTFPVKEGPYHYLMQVEGVRFGSAEELAGLPVALPNGTTVRFGHLAKVEYAPLPATGGHLYNGQQTVAMAIFRQEQARLRPVLDSVAKAIGYFEHDYPGLQFALTQDQSALLDLSIGNLQSALVLGGSLALVLLFLFMGNYRLPLLMGFSLPVSLVLALGVFFLLGRSVNIVSLSGLALGMGMLIDNAIIVIDTISERLKTAPEGLSFRQKLLWACSEGAAQVAGPLVSSALTTLCVFLPLVFLGGTAGMLFSDQAIAVAATLGTSLVVALVLVPLLFRLFHQNATERVSQKETERPVMRLFKSLYHRLHHLTIGHPWAVVAVGLLVFPLVGGWLFTRLPSGLLPQRAQSSFRVNIDWQEPVSLTESLRLLQELHSWLPEGTVSEAEAGQWRYLLKTGQQALNQAEWVVHAPHAEAASDLRQKLPLRLQQRFPTGKFVFADAPGPLDALLPTNRPWLEMRVRLQSAEKFPRATRMDSLQRLLAQNGWQIGEGQQTATVVELVPQLGRLLHAGFSLNDWVARINELFGQQNLTVAQGIGEEMPVRYRLQEGFLGERLKNVYLTQTDRQGQLLRFPLADFTNIGYQVAPARLAADRGGLYFSFVWPKNKAALPSFSEVQAWLEPFGLYAQFTGEYMESAANARQLIMILLLSLALLFVILAAQFESVVQPLWVLLVVVPGLAGGVLALWLSGESLNLMAFIGLIIMGGVVVNDAILKVDTLNRLQKDRPELPINEAVHLAGLLRLRPILMTTFTTVLAVLPILWMEGEGAELQRPLVLALSGGLLAGTVGALTLIPAFALLWGKQR